MTEHLPIQRFMAFDPMLRNQPFDSGLWADAKGQYVTYEDHIAALRACERRVLDAAVQRVTELPDLIDAGFAYYMNLLNRAAVIDAIRGES